MEYGKNTVMLSASALAAALLLFSCSVIEDRSECPRWLEVDCSRCSGLTDKVCNKVSAGDETVYREEMLLSDKEVGSYKLVQDNVDLVTYFGMDFSCVSGDVYTIPEGRETDDFYAYRHFGIVMEGDIVKETVDPWKQFCRIRVRLSDDVEQRYAGMETVISSTSGGTYLHNLAPLKHPYSLSRKVSKDGMILFKVPRQGFGDLRMTFYEDGKYLATADLSRALDEEGYDWNARSLEDTDIVLASLGKNNDMIVTIGDFENGGVVEKDFN